MDEYAEELAKAIDKFISDDGNEPSLKKLFVVIVIALFFALLLPIAGLLP